MPAVLVPIFVGIGMSVTVATIAAYTVTFVAMSLASYLARELFSPETSEPETSPTYGSAGSTSNHIGNTIAEDVPIARCYGICKIGGNKVRFNDADAQDLRVAVAHCLGEVQGIQATYINDLEWSTLECVGKSTGDKAEYTGTRTQNPDTNYWSAVFGETKVSAFRGIAYTNFLFPKNDNQIGYDPNIVVIMQGLKCVPLSGGAPAFTRNPAVILYDWYLNVEGYSADDLDINSFLSLEILCNEIPTSGSLPRYRFDYNFDSDQTINDAKKLLWSSFNGRVVMSQGKLKPIWDSGQIADGSGGLTAKTVSHAFTMDNIVKDSFTWRQSERPNISRIKYIDSTKLYKKTTVEEKDEREIRLNGEILKEETCYFITDSEIARRRAKFKFNRARYTDYTCDFSAFTDSSDLEIFDLVTVTHTLPGWTNKPFIVTQKTEDDYGRMKFTLEAFYSGVYDDSQVGAQETYESALPNPYSKPAPATDVTCTLTAVGTAYDYDAIRIIFTPPVNDPFYSYSEIYASKDDSFYYYIGKNGTGDFTFSGLGVVYEPGDTCYIKLRSVSARGVPGDMPATATTSILTADKIRLGNFYAGLADLWGGNASKAHADTKIIIGDINATPKIALGASADSITFSGLQPGFLADGDGYFRVGGATHGMRFDPTTGIMDVYKKVRVGSSATYVEIDGENTAIQSSNFVSGVNGAGFSLTPDLLEVGNAAMRGIFRSGVFQKASISAVGGNLIILPADVLSANMTGTDDAALVVEGNEAFAVGDMLRIKTGIVDEWLEVQTIDGAPSYGVIRDKAGDYAPGENPVWLKGTTVVNYGQSGAGAVYMTGSDSNSPHISVLSHAGSPWTAITTHLRMGNLNGFLGYATDIFGVAIGETDAYLKYDPTNGLRIKGEITLVGGDVPWGSVSGASKPADNADVTLAAVNGGLTVTGGGITLSGGGSLKGGQTAYATGTGFFLGYENGKYKFSIGDALTKFLHFDGTNVALGRETVLYGTDGYSDSHIFLHERAIDETMYETTETSGTYGSATCDFIQGHCRMNISLNTDIGGYGYSTSVKRTLSSNIIVPSWEKTRLLKGRIQFLNAPTYVAGRFVSGCCEQSFEQGMVDCHFGFYFYGTALHGSVGDGDTHAILDLGVTITNTTAGYLLEAIFTPGVGVTFYVDGVSKGTIATNIPGSVQAHMYDYDDVMVGFEMSGADNLVGSRIIEWSEYMVLQEAT